MSDHQTPKTVPLPSAEPSEDTGVEQAVDAPPEGEEEEGTGPSGFLALLSLLLGNPTLVKEISDSWRENWLHVQNERLTKIEQQSKRIQTRSIIYLVGRYALSAIVVLVIWRLAAAKLLESQALLALLGAVVGSLFVQPRKD
jgi:hypothetical protein